MITTAGQANQLIVSGEAGETLDEVSELLAMIDECHKQRCIPLLIDMKELS